MIVLIESSLIKPVILSKLQKDILLESDIIKPVVLSDLSKPVIESEIDQGLIFSRVSK